MISASGVSASTAVSTAGQVAMHVDTMEKRTASEFASPPHRVDILRARITSSIIASGSVSAVPKSPFNSP